MDYPGKSAINILLPFKYVDGKASLEPWLIMHIMALVAIRQITSVARLSVYWQFESWSAPQIIQ